MKLSRKIALLMIVIHIIFILISLASIIYSYNIYFKDHIEQSINYARIFWLNVVPGFLAIAIYTGMFWVMRRFKERRWLQSGLVVFIICRIAVIILPFIFTRYANVSSVTIYGIIMNFSVFYIAITLALVQDVAIRWYYRAFAFLLMLCLFASSMESGIRDILVLGKILINTQVLFVLPFIASLLLFFKIYGIAKTQGHVQNEIPF